jgi:rod shape-determining protein MreD
LLVLQGVLHHVLGNEWLYPSLILPLILYMAVGEFSLARGASLSFVLGYLLDAFSGLPMGIFTFSMVAVFLLSRVAGLKLFLHGVVFQMLLTLAASIAVAVLIMGLHLVFLRRAVNLGTAIGLIFSQGIATAVVSPLVFAMVRRVPGLETPKPEEG